MLRGVYMIVNSKKRLCASFKWTDPEVKKEIQKHLEDIEKWLSIFARQADNTGTFQV